MKKSKTRPRQKKDKGYFKANDKVLTKPLSG